ncbi:unnamed protein product [Durusdinium trenchii]|uniref:Uncharacterized protein n=1 Tax=Durusdinium trenchii TaxID=1381693 RepID=A0ABP0Q548_9DINO
MASLWAGRAGKESGANFQFIHRVHATDRKDRQCLQLFELHADAAGAASGSRYEVVQKGNSSATRHTQPYANHSAEWLESPRLRDAKKETNRSSKKTVDTAQIFQNSMQVQLT